MALQESCLLQTYLEVLLSLGHMTNHELLIVSNSECTFSLNIIEVDSRGQYFL